MNIFGILSNIYTNKESGWIHSLSDKEIAPYVIQRWLVHNERVKKEARYLDKYIANYLPIWYYKLPSFVLL